MGEPRKGETFSPATTRRFGLQRLRENSMRRELANSPCREATRTRCFVPPKRAGLSHVLKGHDFTACPERSRRVPNKPHKMTRASAPEGCFSHARRILTQTLQPRRSHTATGTGAPSSATSLCGAQHALFSLVRSACIALSSLSTASASLRIRAAPGSFGTTIL